MSYRIFFCLCLSVFIFGCSPNFRFKKYADFKAITVKLDFSDSVDEDIRSIYREGLVKYASIHNSRQHALSLKLVNPEDTAMVRLKIKNVKLVDLPEHLKALGITSLGIIGVPILMVVGAGSPFFLMFWIFPKNHTYARIDFNEDLCLPEYSVYNFVMRSRGGYFRSKKGYKRKLSRGTYKQFKNLFLGMEYIMARNKKIQVAENKN